MKLHEQIDHLFAKRDSIINEITIQFSQYIQPMFYASMNNTFSRLGGMEERLNQITRLSGGGMGLQPGQPEENKFESNVGRANDQTF